MPASERRVRDSSDSMKPLPQIELFINAKPLTKPCLQHQPTATLELWRTPNLESPTFGRSAVRYKLGRRQQMSALGPKTNCEGLPRRDFLKLGLGAFAGLSFIDLIQQRALAKQL